MEKLPVSKASKILIRNFMQEKRLISEKTSHSEYSSPEKDEKNKVEEAKNLEGERRPNKRFGRKK